MSNLKSKQKKTAAKIKKNLITACRILSSEGLVHGFGHVSARIPDSDLFFLTPRVSLALVKEKDLLLLNLQGEVVAGSLPTPFEAPLHTAIFNGRPEVNAIARVHGRRAGYFAVTDRRIEPVHNHGSFFSGGVPVFPKTDLISTQKLGEEVVEAMGKRPAILLRGNGQVAVGRTIPEAVMMAIYLEEAADMLYGALQIGTPIPLTSEESALRKEETLPPVDLERAWNFFKSRLKA
ncbi:class II aldolase/adducin family protein [bacterium]|nr:MAG: class II aldolase/adducin family protein [bacterium]